MKKKEEVEEYKNLLNILKRKLERNDRRFNDYFFLYMGVMAGIVGNALVSSGIYIYQEDPFAMYSIFFMSVILMFGIIYEINQNSKQSMEEMRKIFKNLRLGPRGLKERLEKDKIILRW
ncbi:MAG: hypothetical protein Q7S56_01170 [Nanoarchaeota archaeon]|nr:hypothetical protein [Nanoarchaeota archaeon]